MDPKLDIVPVERGRYPKGCLEVVDSLLCLALCGVYHTKEAVTLANQKLIEFVWEEVGHL